MAAATIRCASAPSAATLFARCVAGTQNRVASLIYPFYSAPCPTLRRASPVLCRPCAFVSFVLPPQACHDAYHPGVECVSSAAREEYLRTREKLLREQGGTGGEAQERLLAARAKLEELKSLDAIRQMSKPCPACGVASEYLRMRRIQCVASNANPRPLLLQPALKRA